MARAKSGGGLTMSKTVHKPQPKVEPKPHKVNVKAVERLGAHDKRSAVEKLYDGPGYKTPVGPTNNLIEGPGAGRDTSHCGSQGLHGSPAYGEGQIDHGITSGLPKSTPFE